MTDIPRVGDIEPGKRTSKILNADGSVRHGGDEPPSGGMVENAACLYNGAQYSDGARVCQLGTIMECQDGHWQFTYDKC